MRRWRNAGGRDLLDLFGVGEEARQLRREERLLVFCELESREPRDALDVLACEVHQACGAIVACEVQRLSFSGS